MQLLAMAAVVIKEQRDDVIGIRRSEQRHGVGIESGLVILRLAAAIDGRRSKDDLAARQDAGQGRPASVRPIVGKVPAVELPGRLPDHQRHQQHPGDVRGHAVRTKGPNDPFLHDGEPRGTSGGRPGQNKHCAQASRRSGAAVAGPMKRLARSIARYAPAARPLTGNTPPISDHRLLSTCSHGLPPLQPITGGAQQIMPAQVGAQRQTKRAQTRQDPAPPGPGPAKTSLFFAAIQTSIISAHRSDSTLRQVANQPAETVGSATVLQEIDPSRLRVGT